MENNNHFTGPMVRNQRRQIQYLAKERGLKGYSTLDNIDLVQLVSTSKRPELKEGHY